MDLFPAIDLMGGQVVRLAEGDRDAVIDAVMAVAAFAAAHRDSLAELDVNPLLVLPEGQGAVAVDALIRMSD